LLNDETPMKCLIEFLMIVETTMNCRSSSWWTLKQWRNCYCLKWPIWGGYIIVLWWILNWIWDIDWAIMNLGCEEWLYKYYEGSIVVFLLNVIVIIVLQRIYRCIFIECNCDNCITKDLSLYYIEWNCHEWLYEYYDTTKRLMFSPKCRSVEVINNPTRPGSNHREVNCINYKQQQQQQE
jgi:hypothetical protein